MPKLQTGWVNDEVTFGFRGWTIDPAHPSRACAVSLLIDGERVATVAADQYRSNLKLEHGSKNHGFSIVPPVVFLDGVAREVALVNTDSGEVLISRSMAFVDARLRGSDGTVHGFGAVTRLDPLRVEGWIAIAYSAAEAALLIDGCEVAHQSADMPIRFVPEGLGHTLGRGFVFRLPRRFFDDASHRITVSAGGKQNLTVPAPVGRLVLSPKDAPALQARFRYDGTLGIKGTIEDRRGGAAPVDLEVLSGPERVAERQRVVVERRSEVSFDLSAERLLIAGEIIVRALPDDQTFPVEAGEELLRKVRVGNASIEEGLFQAEIRAEMGIESEVLVVPAVDGRPLADQAARLCVGPASAFLRLALPKTAKEIDLRWLDGSTSLSGTPLRLGDQTEPPSDAGSPWFDPSDPAVATALAAARSGLLPVDALPGFTGYWSFDAAGGSVRGWALDLKAPLRRLGLRLLVDGCMAARTESGEAVWLVTEAGAGGGRYPVGFHMSLPPLTGRETLSVEIEGGPFLVPQTRDAATQAVHVDGAVLRAARRGFVLEIEGWARNRLRPGAPVQVKLLSGSQTLATLFARKPGRETGFVPPAALLFAFRQPLAESDLQRPLTLALDDLVQLAPVIPLDAERSTSTQVPEPAQPEDIFEGVVNTATPGRVQGWTRCLAAPTRAPELVLHIDGRPFALARCTARSTSDGSAIDGYDFAFALPPNLEVTKPVWCEIKAARGSTRIRDSQFWLRSERPGLAPALLLPLSNTISSASDAPLEVTISAIVLNHNGATRLSDLFASFARVEAQSRVEWIIVDRGSTDGSTEVCDAASGGGLNVRFVKCPRSCTLTGSRNWGARHASGTVLVFADSELVFHNAFANEILQLLADERIGAVGAKLMDGIAETSIPSLPVKHLGIYINPLVQSDFLQPFEARATEETVGTDEGTARVAAAGAFIAMRRVDFEALGGFDEDYQSGLEEFDLCLRVMSKLGKEVVCARSVTIEHRCGYVRAASVRTDPRLIADGRLMNSRWSAFLRRRMREEALKRPAYWTGSRPFLTFLLPFGDLDMRNAAEGLGRELQAVLPLHVRYVEGEDAQLLDEADLVVVMDPRFDLGRAKVVRLHLTAIAWMRDSFEVWRDSPSVAACDFLWAPSERAAGLLSEHFGRRIDVVRNAVDAERFRLNPSEASARRHYVLAAAPDDSAGDAGFALRPSEIHGSIAPSGDGEAAAQYASSRVVIDDAGWEARVWGGGGSRLFEASAAGALVATTDRFGAEEAFGGLMPTWSGDASLTPLLNRWLDDEPGRAALAARLRERVLQEHTFEKRAEQVIRLLSTPRRALRFAIKCPARPGSEKAWGDYHFAKSLARELAAKGHVARIDLRDRWYSGLSDADDVVIVLRGLLAYKPKVHQKNILWLLSHPHDVSVAEASAYDHVFVASPSHARDLAAQLSVPVTPLLQCVDTKLFRFDEERIGRRSDRVLFVGNSRSVFRDAVRWAVESGLDIHVYGDGWESFLPRGMVKGTHVPNEVLGDLYASSRLVLCDHWDDMRRLGFLSNRAFDVLAVGGTLLVDEVNGLEESLPQGGYRVFRDAAELEALIRAETGDPVERRRELARWVAEHHSFARRAETLIELAWELVETLPRNASSLT